MLEYAAGDVVVMPILVTHFLEHKELNEFRKKAVEEETTKRLSEAQMKERPVSSAEGPEGCDNYLWGSHLEELD